MSDKRIPVKALRQGFFDSEIKEIGAKFYVNSVEELGSWMERLDGGKNPKEGAHLKVAKIVEEKLFLPVNPKKLKDPAQIEKEAKKAVAEAHKDRPSEMSITGNKQEELLEGEVTKALTPAEKGKLTKARNAAAKAAGAKKAPAKKAVKDNTAGLI